MADFKYNPDTDEYEYVGNGYEGVPDAVAEPSERSGNLLSQKFVDPVQVQNDALIAEQQANAQAVVANGGDDRPLFAQDAGQFFGDLGKSILNPAAALVTDYVDLGHGLVDVAQQTGNLVQGKGFDGSKVFDDSDNPLTDWRIDTFRSETQAGQFVNTTARVVVALATLPKLALKGLAAPLKLLGRLRRGQAICGGCQGLDQGRRCNQCHPSRNQGHHDSAERYPEGCASQQGSQAR